MSATLPGLELPHAPDVDAILRRYAPEPASPPTPAGRSLPFARRWRWHDLPGGALAIRLDGRELLRVEPRDGGWIVRHAGQASPVMAADEADALAERIARLQAAPDA